MLIFLKVALGSFDNIRTQLNIKNRDTRKHHCTFCNLHKRLFLSRLIDCQILLCSLDLMVVTVFLLFVVIDVVVFVQISARPAKTTRPFTVIASYLLVDENWRKQTAVVAPTKNKVSGPGKHF